jgi:hypothetical protein
MSGLSHISGPGCAPHPFHLDQPPDKEQAEVRLDFGNGRGLAIPFNREKVYRFGPHGDMLEFSPAKKESSRLVRMMGPLTAAAGGLAAGATAAFRTYQSHPVIGTTAALIAGHKMQQWGAPNLPGKFLSYVIGALGTHALDSMKAGGREVVNAATSGNGLAAAGLAAGGLTVARHPTAIREKLTRLLSAGALSFLTALSALQLRATRHP